MIANLFSAHTIRMCLFLFHKAIKLSPSCRGPARIEAKAKQVPWRLPLLCSTLLPLTLRQLPPPPPRQLKHSFSMVAQPVLIRLWLLHLGLTQAVDQLVHVVLVQHLHVAAVKTHQKKSTATSRVRREDEQL